VQPVWLNDAAHCVVRASGKEKLDVVEVPPTLTFIVAGVAEIYPSCE